MGCGCKKKVPTNKEREERDKKIRQAMRAFRKNKMKLIDKSKSGKS
jgi:hypothetical protein